MEKLAAGILVIVSVIGFSGASTSAKKCTGFCSGVSSKAGNPYLVYKPRNTYVAPYIQLSTGRFVQGCTRSSLFGR